MKRHKFSEESIARKRRIEELRERESGYKSGEDTIYDGGEITLSPQTNFHRAAMQGGEVKEHFTE